MSCEEIIAQFEVRLVQSKLIGARDDWGLHVRQACSISNCQNHTKLDANSQLGRKTGWFPGAFRCFSGHYFVMGIDTCWYSDDDTPFLADSVT